MHLMYGDEADHEQDRGRKFFVYGAVFVDTERAHALHTAVDALRAETSFAPGDSLKFATNSRPANVTRAEHTAAKRQLIALAAEHGVQFCAYVMLHELARNTSHEELVQWGANTLLGKFNQFCNERPNGHGMVMFDRMPIAHEHRYFKEKFAVGLTFPNGRTRRLERLLGYASTCDGASHMSSVADVVLGSFRYCVNEPERDVAGRAMFPGVARLMWRRVVNGGVSVRERGLVTRPVRVRERHHAEEYDALRARLVGYLQGQVPA